MDERQTLKDVELQKHYDLLFDLFASPAWGRYVEEAQRFLGGVDSIKRLASTEALFFAKGQLDVLQWIAGFEDATKAAYDQLLVSESVVDVD